MERALRKFKSQIWHCARLAAIISLAPAAVLPQDRVEVAFELPQSRTTTNEPVYIRLSIRNGLKEGIGLEPALGRDSYIDLSVTEPGGSTVVASPVSHGGLLHIPAMLIPPNSSKTVSSLLNELYQFRKPGEYKLKIRLTGSIRTQSGRLVVSPFHELGLSVAPRDPERLEEICQKLAKAAAGYSDYEKLREAAVALSYIEDPVAIPYLGQVLGYHNFVSRLALPGLVRIGSQEALRVLTSNLDTPDTELKMQIEGAIQEIKTGIHPQIMD